MNNIKAVGAFKQLGLALISGSTSSGELCHREIAISGGKWILHGPDCHVRSRDDLGTLWSADIQSEVEFQLDKSVDGKFEAIFPGNNVTWDTGDLLKPALGPQAVKFLTQGQELNGKPAAVWFDGYYCYSVRLKE